MSFDLTDKLISKSFQNLLQKTGSDNILYDLKGNQVTDLRVPGSITANSYIVSSSVSYYTSSHYSGSTKFGDTTNDTHDFTGSLDITGSVYVSDRLYFNAGEQSSPDFITNNNSLLGPQQNQIEFHVNDGQKMVLGSSTISFLNINLFLFLRIYFNKI